MSFLSYTQGFDNNLLMLLLRSNNRYRPIVEFFDNMTQGLSELSWAEAEFIAAEVSKANQSGFCNGIRGGMCRALGVDSSVLLSEKLKVLLSFSLKVNSDAAGMTQVDVDEVLSKGWSEQTVEDIVGLVAIQKLYNVIATGLGFDKLPQDAFLQIGLDTVNKGGYLAAFNSFIEPQ